MYPTLEQILLVIRRLEVRMTRVSGCLVRMKREAPGDAVSWCPPTEAYVEDWLNRFGRDRRSAELMINHVHVYELIDPWLRQQGIPHQSLMEVARAYVALLRQSLIEFCGEAGFEIVVTGESESKRDSSELEVSFCSRG